MAVYDDKTPGIIKSGNYSMISSVKSRTEAVFKASYIVASGIQVEGKITALFDLIVIGDVVAHDIDVKGKFVCLGNCQVGNSVTVQDKLFVKEIRAKSIEVHDDITAQEIDVDVLRADGNVIVGQTLATEELAYSEQNILCGETAYGAGRISAHAIITGEELDMDDGEDAVVDPNKIVFDDNSGNPEDVKRRQTLVFTGGTSASLYIAGGCVNAHFFLRNKFVRESGRAATINVKGPQIAAGRWQKVRLVCDQKTAYLEVDGVRGEPVSVTGDLFYPLYTAVGGGGKGDQFFAGKIKSLKIEVK